MGHQRVDGVRARPTENSDNPLWNGPLTTGPVRSPVSETLDLLNAGSPGPVRVSCPPGFRPFPRYNATGVRPSNTTEDRGTDGFAPHHTPSSVGDHKGSSGPTHVPEGKTQSRRSSGVSLLPEYPDDSSSTRLSLTPGSSQEIFRRQWTFLQFVSPYRRTHRMARPVLSPSSNNVCVGGRKGGRGGEGTLPDSVRHRSESGTDTPCVVPPGAEGCLPHLTSHLGRGRRRSRRGGPRSTGERESEVGLFSFRLGL